jgi:hypothetical protein
MFMSWNSASIAIAVPDPTCIAGFCIELYKGKHGSTDMSERFVSYDKRLSARCRLACVAKWVCFSSPLMHHVFRVSTLTMMKENTENCVNILQVCGTLPFHSFSEV